MTEPAPSSQSSANPSLILVLPALLFLGVGTGLGHAIAYQASLPGLSSLGAVVYGLGLAVLIGVAVVVGAIAAALPCGRGRRVVKPAFAAGGLLLLGALGGYVTVPVLGLEYREPVILRSGGEASVALSRPADFAPVDSGPAECQSVADGEDVQGVTALNLGELLPGGTLRGSIASEGAIAAGGSADVSFLIDGADLEPGADQPTWYGSGSLADPGPTSGRVSFTASLAGGPMGEPIGGSWPATLAGELTWQCGAWFDPNAEPSPPLAGVITLDLDRDDWTVVPDSRATCELEPSGSVWAVTSEVGLLDGAQLIATLDMYGDHRPGDEVLVTMQVVNLAEKGEFQPYWEGEAVVTQVASDERSGRAAFDELRFVPPLDGWPARLSLVISWTCD